MARWKIHEKQNNRANFIASRCRLKLHFKFLFFFYFVSIKSLAKTFTVTRCTMLGIDHEDLRYLAYVIRVRLTLSQATKTKKFDWKCSLFDFLKDKVTGCLRMSSDKKTTTIDAINRRTDCWFAYGPENTFISSLSVLKQCSGQCLLSECGVVQWKMICHTIISFPGRQAHY